MYMTVNLQLIN